MNLVDFHFIRPYWLFALIPMLLFITLSVRNKLAQGNWTEVCDSALLPFILQETNTQSSRRWISITMSIASLLAIIALAGPTWERLPTPDFRNDAALVIALDLSRSMDATDIKPSRLTRARYKIADILQQRKDGLTALTVYAGDAFTVTPLTEDTATISNQLNALTTDIMPSQGSNTLAAIELSVQLMQQAGQQQGSILLITDGINARLLDTVNEALGNYKLSVLGIGTPEGAPVQLAVGGFLKDRQGNIVVPKLEASPLSSLANAGNGMYQTISRDDGDIHHLMAYLDRTTQASTEHATDHIVEQWVEQGPWLLLVLLPLSALYFRKGLLVIPLIMLMNFPQDSYAFGWQDLWQTADQQAQQSFNQQQYEQAANQFTSPEWQAAAHYKAAQYQQAVESLHSLEHQSADSLYNQATALAKSGQLQPALDAYQQALTLNPQHEDALYNKKRVEQALEKQQKDKDKNKDKQNQKQSNKNKSNPSDKQQQKPDDKKSDSSDNQKNSQNSKPQQSANQHDQPSQQQSSDDQRQQESNQNKDTDKAQAQQAEPDQQKAKAKQQDMNQTENEQKKPAQQQSEQQTNEDREQEQAQAQWLKRIPDDPAGLLKRKFKYQYNQRSQRSQQEQSW